MKVTLTENYEEAITVEKDLHAIGIIINDESLKYSKYMGKMSQASAGKAK